MCQTFYLCHENCTCIYILQVFIPCATYSLVHSKETFYMPDPFAVPKKSSTGPDPFADPEEEPSPEPNPFADPEEENSTESDPFADPEIPIADPDPKSNYVALGPNSKILTEAYARIDFTYEGIDFVSIDVDDIKAPKALKCSAGITARQVYCAGRGYKLCMLCDRPKVLTIVEEMVKWREEGKGKGKEKGILRKTVQMGTAALKSRKSQASSIAKISEDSSGEASATAQKEKPKRGWIQRLKMLLEDPENTMYMESRERPIIPFC